jgi:hypothetical protein
MSEIRATLTATMKDSRNDSGLTVVQAMILDSLSKPRMAVVSSTALARRDICALRIALLFPAKLLIPPVKDLRFESRSFNFLDKAP